MAVGVAVAMAVAVSHVHAPLPCGYSAAWQPPQHMQWCLWHQAAPCKRHSSPSSCSMHARQRQHQLVQVVLAQAKRVGSELQLELELCSRCGSATDRHACWPAQSQLSLYHMHVSISAQTRS